MRKRTRSRKRRKRMREDEEEREEGEEGVERQVRQEEMTRVVAKEMDREVRLRGGCGRGRKKRKRVG